MVDASRLWADAGTVIALRSWRIMAGGTDAACEFERMMSEKVDAAMELGAAFAGGRVTSPEGASRTAMQVFGRKVRANRKRLG
ncbi:hypothetical protein H8M03_07065 [Sphingomonas sabuli]|uniref:Uncharacterized protein n=2 Tax=Sphingomonas sabuli TaxID=2764186 RepID=A0A7G9L5Y0_9SPHN|nr:hypothetical protein H8M03_07065 [Sphingomonas sabuli]